MKVELRFPDSTTVLGDFGSTDTTSQVSFSVAGSDSPEPQDNDFPAGMPDPAEVAAKIPDFETLFYSEDQLAIVAETEMGLYCLTSLPPGGPRDDGLYWDGPYTEDQINDMLT